MKNSGRLRAYGVALAALLAALLLRWALEPAVAGSLPFVTFLAAAAFATWWGGLGPGLLALGSGAILGLVFFASPPGLLSFDSSSLTRAGLYLVLGGITAALLEILRRARRRAEALAEESEARRDALELQVAERAKVDLVLREQREWLEVALASIDDAVIVTDASGRVTFMNSRAEELTGWILATARGRGVEEVFDVRQEGTKQRSTSPVESVLREDRVVELASGGALLVSRDGSDHIIEGRAAPTRTPSGDVASVVLVFRDLTEPRRREAERYYLASIVDSSQDAILGKTPEGIVTSWNSAAEKLYGYASREIVGQPIATIVPTDRLDELERIMADLRRGEVTSHVDTVRRRKDGTRVEVSVTVSPIRDPQGNLIGASTTARDITDRRRLQDALRRSASELADFFETATIGIHWVGPDGVILRANQAELDLLGYSREEYVGRSIREFHEQSNVIDEVLERLHRGETVREVPARLRGKDGALKDVLFDASAYFEDGRLVHIRGITRDVTDRKRVEQTVSENEERLRLALEAGRMGTWEWDLATDRVIWSPGLELIHGLEPGTFEGTFAAAQADVHPDDRERVGAAIAESIERGKDHRIEYRVVKPDRGARWVEGRGRLVGASSGEPRRMAGVCMDITDRKRAERTLRFLADASAELSRLSDYQSTLQAVACCAVRDFADWCAVDIVGPDSAVRRLATAHRDPRKLPLVQGLEELDRLDPDAPFGIHSILQHERAELSVEVASEVLSASAKDASSIAAFEAIGPSSFIGVPLRGRGGVIGVLSFVAFEGTPHYDFHDLAAAEDFGHRAAIAIENARLFAEVCEADRRKDEFLAVLAHELRNPLAPIRGALEIMSSARHDPELQERARGLVERQVEQLVRLVDDLLDVSRITRGRVDLRRERVTLRSVTESALESAHPMIEAAGQQLDVDLPAEPVILDADPIRLSQVFANLLANASKYTREGGHIWLSARRAEDDVEVKVGDDGIGIKPEMLSQIFEIFTQDDRAHARAQGGLGIGLSLVRGLVELHGGTVEARSEGEGRGSEFVVRLPLAAAAAAGAPPTPEPRDSRARLEGPLMRILVVDDNADAAESLSILLRMQGHEVRVAYDGLEALDLAAELMPDLVLLDIGLPRLDGYEVARRLRQFPGGDGMIMVAVTGWGQAEDRRRSREAGFDHHLVKPLDFAALDQLLVSHAPEHR